MTLNDFSVQFDLGYNNALKLQAPGLNVYEKSLYLTKAFRQLIKDYARDFEVNEKSKELLSYLVQDLEVTYDSSLNSTLATLKLSSSNRVFELPEGVWFILQERLYTSDTKSIEVKPVRLDEYNESIKNPFREPNSRKAWRLTVGDNRDEPSHIVEIATTLTPTKYKFRYLKKPGVIILADLKPFGWNIEDVTAATLPIGNDLLHEAIVDRAVILATKDYKENNLQSQMALDNN